MTQDDFHPANEDDNIVEDILKAVSPAKDAEVVESLCPCDYCAKGPYCKSLCNGEIEMISDCFQGRRLTDSKDGE